MIGICGVYSPYNRKESWRKSVRSMTASLTHDGVCQDKIYEMGPLSIGIRQFSTCPKESDLHPIPNEDNTLQLVCNGQVYGSETIRKKLEETGHLFKTQDNTEVILHLYEEHGLDFFDHFDGMFALVLWDERKQRLVIARDRFGIKPFFYTLPENDGSFSFSSQLAPLIRLPGLTKELDPVAVHQFFAFSYLLHPRTIYYQIRKVSPGNYLKAEGNKFDIASYWELPTHLEPLDIEEGGQCLDAAISKAVAARMPQKGTLCTFLSGGTDSSTVAYHMTRNSNRRVHTFSARFPSREGYDEGPMAQITAQHLGTEHHEIWMNPKDVSLLPELMAHFGEPFADPSAIPTFLASRQIREMSPISLCGDGADEVLGGYEIYGAAQMAHLARYFPESLRQLSLSALTRFPISLKTAGLDIKLRRFFSGSNLPPLEQHEMWKIYLTEEQKTDFYTPEFRDALGSTGTFPLLAQWRSLFNQADRDWLTPIQYLDIKTYLVDNNMTKVECSGMANGLEVRMPYLDLNVFLTALRLPAKARTHWGKRKILAKKLMKGRLPDVILKGRKKGFGVPLAPWFLGPLEYYVEEMLRPERIAQTGIIRPEVGRELIAMHKGRRLNMCRKMWNLICFLSWFENNQNVASF